MVSSPPTTTTSSITISNSPTATIYTPTTLDTNTTISASQGGHEDNRMSSINAGANASTRLQLNTRDDYGSFLFDFAPSGVSIPTRYVYYIGPDNSIQRAGTIGVEFAVVNPADGQRHTFTGLLDSGSSQPVISSRIAKEVGVKSYPPSPNPSNDYTIPLEIVSLAGIFPVDVSIVPDYYPCLIPPRIFTKYYNLIFTSAEVVFTKRRPIHDGIPITQTKLGPFIDVDIDGVNVRMVADTRADDGSLTNATAAMLDMSRFQKIRGPYKNTRGHITKTVTDYSVPLTIDGITYVESMSVGVDTKSDQIDNVFPLEGLVQDGFQIELAYNELKITPPPPSQYTPIWEDVSSSPYTPTLGVW